MNLARSLPLGHTAPSADLGTLKEMTPQEAAFYGPQACISTFRSPAGTCIVQTRCQSTDITMYDVGITCLDKSGDYTRYLFGKGNFEKEETFDTRIECEVCLGVGAESGEQQIHGAIPKQLVEDVNTLKDEVLALKLEVRALQTGAGHPGGHFQEDTGDELVAAKVSPFSEKAKKNKHVLTNAEKGLDQHGNPLAPAPAVAAAPAEKLEAHEVKSFAHGAAPPAAAAPSSGHASAPSSGHASAPSHGGHSLADVGYESMDMIPAPMSAMDATLSAMDATIPAKVSAMDFNDAAQDSEETVVVHHRRPTPSPLQDLLRRLAN